MPSFNTPSNRPSAACIVLVDANTEDRAQLATALKQAQFEVEAVARSADITSPHERIDLVIGHFDWLYDDSTGACKPIQQAPALRSVPFYQLRRKTSPFRAEI